MGSFMPPSGAGNGFGEAGNDERGCPCWFGGEIKAGICSTGLEGKGFGEGKIGFFIPGRQDSLLAVQQFPK